MDFETLMNKKLGGKYSAPVQESYKEKVTAWLGRGEEEVVVEEGRKHKKGR